MGKIGGFDVFKNMKIKVENNLDEIVAELERLGYKRGFFGIDSRSPILVVNTMSNGTYECFNYLFGAYGFNTTLAELKEM